MIQDVVKRIQNRESFLLAADGQFIGKLTSNPYDVESISNRYGIYGSQYSSTSIWNKYSQYGSKYAVYSAYNQYTSTPPIIYLRGLQYGFLTKNLFKYKNVDPDNLIEWMQQNNL